MQRVYPIKKKENRVLENWKKVRAYSNCAETELDPFLPEGVKISAIEF